MTTGYRYPMRQCPHCGRWFANVKNHILMKHASGVSTLTAEDLLGRSSSESPAVSAPEDPEYFCTVCGARGITRGDAACPRCGVELEWSGL